MTKTKLIVNLTRGGVLCVGELADRPLPRMRGLMGRRGLPAGEGMLLTPAPAIHTAFMRFPIDALFLDGDLQVLEIVEQLRPWRVASKRSARSVLELSAGECARRGVKVGDRLELRDRADQGTAPIGPEGSPDVDTVTAGLVAEPALDWSAGQVARLRPMRILISSADPRFRNVMSLLLARRNCSVTTTANGARLGELIARERSDVVVFDTNGSPRDAQLASALDTIARPIGVVFVADDATPGIPHAATIAKWGPFDELMAAIEHADEHRATGAVPR
ncbi:MAG: uncharacterized protein QOG40_1242 [Solirubrobacteraceae bacterium]|nr:uncharacterized protein [Solirubrobacteraceae bacterium]